MCFKSRRIIVFYTPFRKLYVCVVLLTIYLSSFQICKKCSRIIRFFFLKFLFFLRRSSVATTPTLVFLTAFFLPACHNVNRFVASFVVLLLYFLHLIQKIIFSLYLRYCYAACNEWWVHLRGLAPGNIAPKKHRSDGESLATLCPV